MRHQVVDARGTRIHCVEEGSGPLVLFVHGFPESWYSWRHQMPVIADAGFRAVAIDVRGYGRSSAPLEVEAYGMLEHIGDNLGVVEALTGREVAGDHHRPRLGGADRRPLGTAASGHLHRGSDAQCSLQPPGRSAAHGSLRRDGEAGRPGGGVLHQLLPGAGTGRAGGRDRRAIVAARLLRRGVGGRGEVGVRQGDHRHRGSRQDAAGPLSRHRCASRLAHRGRPRVLRRGV